MRSQIDAIQATGAANDLPEAIAGHYKILIDVLGSLSEAYFYQGQLERAVQLHESNTHVLSAHGVAREDKARFQAQRGKMLYYQSSLADSSFDAAWSVLLDAQELGQSSTDRDGLAKTLDLMGLVLYSQAFSNHDFEKPRGYFQQALELRQELGDARGICQSLFHLGLTYQHKDDRTDAERSKGLDCFYQAQALAQTGAYKLEESYIARHIAAEHQEDGDWEKALDGYKRSLALREQIGYKVYQPSALLTLGHWYSARQEFDQAMTHYQRAYTLAGPMDAITHIVRALMAMGDAEKGRGNALQGLKHYNDALLAAQAADYQNGIAEATAKIKDSAQAP